MRSGTAGARMQEIAAEAGVNQALLHYYFRTKDGLSGAVFEQFASRLFPALFQALSSDAALEDKARAVIDAYLDNLSKNPFLPGYILSEIHHHPERVAQLVASGTGENPRSVFPAILKKLSQQISDRVEAGTMRPIAPDQFVINLISLCIFPFAARPMLGIALGMDDAAFAKFIERRRTELPVFFAHALRA
jgi:TetR/AcrR family transcriptional regulator